MMATEFDSHLHEIGMERISCRDRPPRLTSVVVDLMDRPTQRTIYPTDVAPVVQIERWITTRNQDFVDIGECR